MSVKKLPKAYSVIKANWPKPKRKKVAAEETPKSNQRAIELLDQWLAEDVQESSETWEKVARLLDENRLSNRKIFS